MTTSSLFRFLLIISLLLAVSGCKRKVKQTTESPQAPETEEARGTQPAKAETPPEKKQEKLTWSDPAGWKRGTPSSAMRMAQYEVPAAKGDSEAAELAVFYFGPGQGGSVTANLNRWIAQFSGVDKADVQRQDRNVNGLEQHTVEIAKGTYASGMPGGPKQAMEGWGLLGAIVEAPSGSYFFKLTGPSKTVTEAKKAFYQLLDSVKSGS